MLKRIRSAVMFGIWVVAAVAGWVTESKAGPAADPAVARRLYVAVPGIRDYLEFGGHGVLVFDIDDGYRFVRRIPGVGRNAGGAPMNVKGIVACAATGRLYVSTLEKLACYELATDRLLWERAYEGGCDRMSATPDGGRLFLPSLEKAHWLEVEGTSGEVRRKLAGFKAAHNTVVGLDGRWAYLADRSSVRVAVVDVAAGKVAREVGPFGGFVRPFTVNGSQTRLLACVDDLLGFEVADLGTGRVLHRVEVVGFAKGPVKRHGCPSHGVGLTPDEREIWVADAANQRVHIFDNTVEPPRQVASVGLREQPGWVTFRLDGKHAWPSTGEVVDVGTRRVVATLTDETGAAVHSEKLVEVQFVGTKAVRAGDQFGLGRAR